MPVVNARLGEIQELIRQHDPFNRVGGTVYVDAQAAIQWIRLDVFDDVLDLLSIGSDYLPRFRMQDAVFREACGVLSGRFGIASRDDVAAYLTSQPNLLIDGPLIAGSPVGERAVFLQAQMFIQEDADPEEHPKKHLGEAETLAMIEHLHPASLFVSADGGAVKVARDLNIGVVRPLAFVGGVVTDRTAVTEVWKHLCLGRLCIHAEDFDLDCVEALECTRPTDYSLQRCPIGSNIASVVDVLSWVRNDLTELSRVV